MSPDDFAAGPKPGWQTTEFWQTQVFQAVVIVLVLTGHLDGSEALGALVASGIGQAGYAASRAVAKRS